MHALALTSFSSPRPYLARPRPPQSLMLSGVDAVAPCCYFALYADNQAAIVRAGTAASLLVLLRGDGGERLKRRVAVTLNSLSFCRGEGASAAVGALGCCG
jgi:hypothetical protein